MIRSSQHSLKFCNAGKKNALRTFLSEYRVAVQQYINFLWEYEYTYGNRVLNIRKNQLDCPVYIDYKVIRFPTNLSARALSSAATQACGMVKAALKKQQQRLFVLNEQLKAGEVPKHLAAKVARTRLIKPSVPQDFKAELSSKCATLLPSSETAFEYFLKLGSLGKFDIMYLPIKKTKHSNRLASLGNLMTSFLISEREINLRYDITVAPKVAGQTVGLDQGISTLISLSDGTTSPLCPHGHSMRSIVQRLSRQCKGSRSHQRTQAHRKNYIGYCLNQLNWGSLKQINVEDISDLGRYQRKNRFLSHWNPGVILDKLSQKAELHGVHVKLQSCTYRSQRCSGCGWVRKANRKGKDYVCNQCGFRIDADINAAKNNAADLSPIPRALRLQRKNLKGFYWLEGQELRVPDTTNAIND